MVAAAARILPDITAEEMRALGFKGLSDIKHGDDFKWISSQQAKTVLNKLLPGSWSTAQATELGHHCPGGCRYDARTGTLREITAGAAQALHKTLDYGQVATIATIQASTADRRRALAGQILCWRRKIQERRKTTVNHTWIQEEWEEAKEMICDVTLPRSFSQLAKEWAPQLIVVAPRDELIDIILPLAVRIARRMTCCLVPTEWQQNAQGPRADWIANLRRYCNLRTVQVKKGEGEKHMEWIIIDSLAKD